MNYADITNLALSYIDRINDTDLIARIPGFLLVVEARINRALKTRQMSARAATPLIDGQEYYALPPDFAGMQDVELRTDLISKDRISLQYATPERMNNLSLGGYSGKFVFYSIVANQLQVYPVVADKIIEMIYYRRLPPLTAQNDSNWLSDLSPDVYTFGLLVEMNSYVKDAETAVLWDKRFVDALDGIATDDNMNRWGGPAMAVTSI